MQDPSQGKLRDRQSSGPSDLIAQAVDDAHILAKVLSGQNRLSIYDTPRTPIPALKREVLGKRSRQQAVGQRSVCHHTDPVLMAVGKYAPLHASVEQIVADLHDVNRTHFIALYDKFEV